jgi:hypothetical protein
MWARLERILAWAFCHVPPVVLGLALMTGNAGAHQWYEAACCSDRDCAPVDDDQVRDTPDGGVDVDGFGHLNKSDSRLRLSRDYQNHLCIIGGKLLCVYRRPKGT